MFNLRTGRVKTGCADIYRYARFLITTLTFKTYSGWKKAGKPNPLGRRQYRVKTTTRHEIEGVFSGNLARHRLRMLCLACLNRQPEGDCEGDGDVNENVCVARKLSKNSP